MSEENKREPGSGFVVREPLLEKPKVVYRPGKHDPVFSCIPDESKAVGYELDENDLLRKLKGESLPIHVKEIKMSDGFWVSDGIGNDYTCWDSNMPVFISAQTGRGKNHFIERVLIPHVKDNINYDKTVKKEILILSNRIALNAQVKKRIENTGIAKVLLYQGLLSFIGSHKSLDKYKYIICDECHFFTADSMFNPNTALILDKLIRRFQHAARIYMSSTFTDCLQYLLNFERRIYSELNDKPFTGKKNKVLPPDNLGFKYFIFERDYSYFKIHYYSQHSDLKDIIIESLMNKEKWLIFIDNKKQCEKLKKELLKYYEEEYGDEHGMGEEALLNNKDIKLISADSKKDQEYMESIVAEKFDCKILISTSVIDNGINLKDDALKNIVISDIFKSKCLQMVGRKRIKFEAVETQNMIPCETVNLYIMQFDKGLLNNRISDLEEQKEAYGLYKRAYDNSYDTENTKWEILNAKREFNTKFYNNKVSDFKKAKHWFYRDDEYPALVRPNKITVSFVDEVLLPRHKYILERMRETGSGQEFLEHQLSWFGKTYDEAIASQNTISAKELFAEFIASLPSRTVFKNEQESFKMEFFNKFNKAYGFRKKELGYSADDNESRVKKEGYGMNIIKDIMSILHINMTMRTDEDGSWAFIEI